MSRDKWTSDVSPGPPEPPARRVVDIRGVFVNLTMAPVVADMYDVATASVDLWGDT